MLSRNEFTILCTLLKHPGATQRELANLSGLSLGIVNGTHKSIVKARLFENGEVSPRGIRELSPYKVDNAIIMAAGISSRFAPISYEKPKGLLTVRGEVLVERQIQQLRAAGVDRIILVVGYRKELFFYLEDKYGVEVVVNPDFATRNNHSTLMRVRKQLGNSYICSSDNYFTQNPFEEYVWKSYYAAEYAEGPTKEWCLTFDKKHRITDVTIGGRDAWYMTGHAYFDRVFSGRMADILEEEYDSPATVGKLWEQLYKEHIDELDMEIRCYEPGTIYEFDSLDELRDFDPLFLENVDVAIFDNIVSVLGCKKSEIHDVYPLKQGHVNLSCHFATEEGEYVYRHPRPDSSRMVDWSAETQGEELARAIGLDASFMFEDPRSGWKLSRFIPDCKALNPHDDAQVADAMSALRKLHSQGAVLSRTFDYLTEGMQHDSYLRSRGRTGVRGYDELKEQAIAAKRLADSCGARICPTHNNFSDCNLLYDGAGNLHVIDWKYAGMSDYASDFGTFVVACALDKDEAQRALELYFGRKPTAEERLHNLAYVGLAGWCWYLWALHQEADNDFMGNSMYTYYRYARHYLQAALSACG